MKEHVLVLWLSHRKGIVVTSVCHVGAMIRSDTDCKQQRVRAADSVGGGIFVALCAPHR